jgi:hypothetical protein
MNEKLPVKPATTALEEPRKLDDVLLAMDVVDTLRHRERVVDIELDAEAREAQLIQRLKEIYDAQGIEVPERILKDGVKALEEQRFSYKPPQDGLSVKLARLYVNRKAWLPGATMLVGAVAFAIMGGLVFTTMQAGEWRRLPAELSRLSAEGQALAVDADVDQRIQAIERQGQRAIAARDRSDARAQVTALEDMNDQLAAEYDLRIVSRPGEDTGFYRIPDNNPIGRNYYLVVEAVAPGGRVLDVPVLNEETQKTARVEKWAQRVSEAKFNEIADDKAPDQIVQNDILGYKARGKLVPEFATPVPGGAITSW